ncbi:MAG: class I SAM-dependent methyltransferase, partial [Roseiflexaceae bacterium]|nr:class I SAM-dependent methyltransferase [Roseiflexaceae bacterium]
MPCVSCYNERVRAEGAPVSAIYHDYAPFYDGSGQLRFAVLIAHYLDELLQHHPVAGRRALDIACGTGTLALLLADKGWDVIGIDQSAAMLGLARTKADALDAPGTATFFQADMRNFARPQPRAF